MANRYLPSLSRSFPAAVGITLAVLCADAQAQDGNAPAEPASQEVKVSPMRPLSVGLGLQVGTLGPGLNLAFAFHDHWQFRLNGSYLQVDYNENSPQLDYAFESTAKTGAVSLLADWFPFEKAKGVGFTAGILYNFVAIEASGRSTRGYGNENLYVEAEEIGTISTRITPNRVAPYLALGFGRTIPNKIVSFRFELGAFYMGSPTVEMTATGLVEPTAEEASKIEENMSNYSFYPNISFHLNFRLK